MAKIIKHLLLCLHISSRLNLQKYIVSIYKNHPFAKILSYFMIPSLKYDDLISKHCILPMMD